jgi:hypothetical protein
MPHPFSHTSKDQYSENVINLKTNLVSCLNLLNDPTSIQMLEGLL